MDRFDLPALHASHYTRAPYFENPYEILGISAKASDPEISEAECRMLQGNNTEPEKIRKAARLLLNAVDRAVLNIRLNWIGGNSMRKTYLQKAKRMADLEAAARYNRKISPQLAAWVKMSA